MKIFNNFSSNLLRHKISVYQFDVIVLSLKIIQSIFGNYSFSLPSFSSKSAKSWLLIAR